MAEEKEKVRPGDSPENETAGGEPGDPNGGKEGGKKRGKRGGKRSRMLLILAPVAVIALAAGGYFGYTFLSQGKGKGVAHAKAVKEDGKPVLFSIDPFVVNLSEPGRYLKVTMQFELAGESYQALATEKVPILRDAIITLIGNQTYEYAASNEGKAQLKDEILLRTNRIFGKEVFRNLYFTDFVMQ
jgi:flagellar FliL protein